jgi:hypothetical protein
MEEIPDDCYCNMQSLQNIHDVKEGDQLYIDKTGDKKLDQKCFHVFIVSYDQQLIVIRELTKSGIPSKREIMQFVKPFSFLQQYSQKLELQERIYKQLPYDLQSLFDFINEEGYLVSDSRRMSIVDKLNEHRSDLLHLVEKNQELIDRIDLHLAKYTKIIY